MAACALQLMKKGERGGSQPSPAAAGPDPLQPELTEGACQLKGDRQFGMLPRSSMMSLAQPQAEYAGQVKWPPLRQVP